MTRLAPSNRQTARPVAYVYIRWYQVSGALRAETSTFELRGRGGKEQTLPICNYRSINRYNIYLLRQ